MQTLCPHGVWDGPGRRCSWCEGDDRDELLAEIECLRVALEAIAAPMRLDGTFNLSREACQWIAQRALHGTPESRNLAGTNTWTPHEGSDDERGL